MWMRTALLCALFCIASSSHAADKLTDEDIGAYVVLDQHFRATDVYYRLSRSEAKWQLEGKQFGGGWMQITCQLDCDYQVASAEEIQQYFPEEWHTQTRIACIRNRLQAFCRYTVKQEPDKGGYLVISLAMGQPVPLFLRKVAVD